MGGVSKAFGGLGDMIGSVMKKVDPLHAAIRSEVRGELGMDAPKQPNALLGETGTQRQAVDENTTKEQNDKRKEDAAKRRQGPAGAGSTLLVTTDDEKQRLERSTLLGL